MTPALQTRKPTGKPSWPIALLAGAEKTGKSYSAALAAASEHVGRTYWVTIGEDQPDEYGLLADFEIVLHDGKYRSILNVLRAIAHQPAPANGVPLLIVDSMTRLWDLISTDVQDMANQRKGGREESTVTPDLWNLAAGRWADCMDAIREFPGPVVLTARLSQVAVMNAQGSPTAEKQSKIGGHKTLPFDVGAIFEMPSLGERYLAGTRSVRHPLPKPLAVPAEVQSPIAWLWERLGVVETGTSTRDHLGTAREEQPFDAEGLAASLDLYTDVDQLTKLWTELQAAKRLNILVGGKLLGDYLRARKAKLLEEQEQAELARQAAAADAAAEQPPLEEPYEDEVPF